MCIVCKCINLSLIVLFSFPYKEGDNEAAEPAFHLASPFKSLSVANDVSSVNVNGKYTGIILNNLVDFPLADVQTGSTEDDDKTENGVVYARISQDYIDEYLRTSEILKLPRLM